MSWPLTESSLGRWVTKIQRPLIVGLLCGLNKLFPLPKNISFDFYIQGGVKWFIWGSYCKQRTYFQLEHFLWDSVQLLFIVYSLKNGLKQFTQSRRRGKLWWEGPRSDSLWRRLWIKTYSLLFRRNYLHMFMYIWRFIKCTL